MFNEDRVFDGVMVWLGTTILAIVVVVLLGGALSSRYPALGGAVPFAPFQIGIWQWLYILPLILWLRRKSRFETAKGVTIAACVVAGINVLCSGILFWGLRTG
jgi:hypothetical protein